MVLMADLNRIEG